MMKKIKEILSISIFLLLMITSCGEKISLTETNTPEKFASTVVELINDSDLKGLESLFISEDEILMTLENTESNKMAEKYVLYEMKEKLSDYKIDLQELLNKFQGKKLIFVNCKYDYNKTVGKPPSIDQFEIKLTSSGKLFSFKFNYLLKTKNGWRSSSDLSI